jgi:hypothetical protein
MTRKKKRTKRTKATRIGSRLVALALALVSCAPFVLGEKKETQQNASAPYALLAGTVYRPPGFALPGVKVVIEPEERQVGSIKLKKVETTTDSRGEWAVRVPPVPAKWRIDVKVNGYRAEQRVVTVEGEQRLETSLVLEPARPPSEAKPVKEAQ